MSNQIKNKSFKTSKSNLSRRQKQIENKSFKTSKSNQNQIFQDVKIKSFKTSKSIKKTKSFKMRLPPTRSLRTDESKAPYGRRRDHTQQQAAGGCWGHQQFLRRVSFVPAVVTEPSERHSNSRRHQCSAMMRHNPPHSIDRTLEPVFKTSLVAPSLTSTYT